MTDNGRASAQHFRVKRVDAKSTQEIGTAIRAIEECRLIVARGGNVDLALFDFELALHRRADALTEDRSALRTRLRAALAKLDELITGGLPEDFDAAAERAREK